MAGAGSPTGPIWKRRRAGGRAGYRRIPRVGSWLTAPPLAAGLWSKTEVLHQHGPGTVNRFDSNEALKRTAVGRAERRRHHRPDLQGPRGYASLVHREDIRVLLIAGVLRLLVVGEKREGRRVALHGHVDRPGDRARDQKGHCLAIHEPTALRNGQRCDRTGNRRRRRAHRRAEACGGKAG